MKLTIALLFAFVAVAIARPDVEVLIEKELHENEGINGDFKYGYRLSDGTVFKQVGKLEDAGGEEPSLSVKGSFSFVEDGKVYTVRYIADAAGFRAAGDHLPKVE